MDKFPGREEECLELLRRTFLNCLEEASRQNFRSIAIPAISSGIQQDNGQELLYLSI